MRRHLAHALVAGLLVGLAVAALDAAVLGFRGWRWLAYAYIAYGASISALNLALALCVSAASGLRRLDLGPRTMCALYLGTPASVLVALAGAEFLRRVGLPFLFRRGHDAVPAFAASLWGVLVGCGLAATLVAAWRRDRRAPARGSSPLGRFAGPAIVLTLLLSFGLALSELSVSRGEGTGGGLIIVCVDALRADHLSCYGYERPTSPNIDKLAEAGARFDRAIAQSPGTTASVASILTSLYPLTHGAWNVGATLNESVQTLAEHLKGRGYATAFFGNNYFLHPRFGFSQGFEAFGNEGLAYEVRGAPLKLLARSLGAVRLSHAWWTNPGEPSEFSVEQAISWLERHREERFFLFLHIMDPHSPYSAPAKFRKAFFSRDYGFDLRDGRELRNRLVALSDEERQQLVDLYDGEVAYADSKVGRLRDALAGLGLLESTLVVVTADHGEVLDEHGGLFNHGYLWDSCLRVPLIMSYPGRVPKGAVYGEVVESVDIAPTALALLGEPALEEAQGDDLSGLMAGRAMPGEDAAFTLGGITKGEGYAITTSRWKLAWIDSDRVRLYDLAQDPGETRDVRAEVPEVAAQLEARLLEWVKETREAAVGRGEIVPLKRLDREVRDRLRALGYVD